MDNSNLNQIDLRSWMDFLRRQTWPGLITWGYISTHLLVIKYLENSGGIKSKVGNAARIILNYTIKTVYRATTGDRWNGKYQEDLGDGSQFILYVEPYFQRKQKNHKLDALEKKASQVLNSRKVWINGEEKSCMDSCWNAMDTIGRIIGNRGKIIGKGSSVFLAKQLEPIKQYLDSNGRTEDWNNLNFKKFSGEHGQRHNITSNDPPGADTDVEMHLTEELTDEQQQSMKNALMDLMVELDEVCRRLPLVIRVGKYELRYMGSLNEYVNEKRASHHARTIKANKWSGMTTTRHSGEHGMYQPLVIYSGCHYQFGKRPFNLLRIRSKWKATNVKTGKCQWIYPEILDISQQCSKNGITTKRELKELLKYYVKRDNVYIPVYDFYCADVDRMILEQRDVTRVTRMMARKEFLDSIPEDAIQYLRDQEEIWRNEDESEYRGQVFLHSQQSLTHHILSYLRYGQVILFFASLCHC